jgi:FlaA1/EpsC-like NDP-sugar epimerase
LNRLGLIKSDVWRSLLILADSLVVFGAYALALVMFFDGFAPTEFELQAYFLSVIFWCLSIGSFAYLRLYSRKLPNFSSGDMRQLLTVQVLILIVFYFLSTWVVPFLWVALISFLLALFVSRACIGLWASYSKKYVTWPILYVVPFFIALLTAVQVGSRELNGLAKSLELVPVSKSIALLYFFLSLSGFAGVRLFESYVWRLLKGRRAVEKVVAIGGAESLTRMLRFNDREALFDVKALLSLDSRLNGVRINRVLVESVNLKEITKLLTRHRVQKILLADSLKKSQLKKMQEQISKLDVSIIEMDSFLGELNSIRSKSTNFELKEVSISDLLRRKQYQFVPSVKNNYLIAKRVLITGAGGSIGSELCRQVAECEPSEIILLGKGENSIFNIMLELHREWPHVKVSPLILSVTNLDGLRLAFEKYNPEVVFHAAAHKHVYLMEQNPEEAELNNVVGTTHVAELCGVMGVQKFVLISTDKAVRPSSVMGKSKAKAERAVLEVKPKYPKTDYRMVRFGNVLGSRGSVIPIFLEQISRGGPITVTDPGVKRYFMSIPEAVSLVLTAGVLIEPADVYVLEMGEQVLIVDLAKQLIEQAGLVYDEDIKIEFTGLKQGEKLEEELWEGEKQVHPTENNRIYGVKIND